MPLDRVVDPRNPFQSMPHKTHGHAQRQPGLRLPSQLRDLGEIIPSAPCDYVLPVAGEVIVVNHGASGVGDAMLGLTAVFALRQETGNPVHFKVSEAALPFVQLFAGVDATGLHQSDTRHNRGTDIPLNAVPTDRQLNRGYSRECVNQGKLNRWARYCANIGAVRPQIPPLREPQRVQDLAAGYKGCIVLAPGSKYDARSWPQQHWLSLESFLLRSGKRCVVLDSDATRVAAFESEKVIAQPPDQVASLILNAAAVIGVDSGMAHFAGILGRPTIVVCGPTSGDAIFGAYAGTISLRGQLDCHGCYWQRPYNEPLCYPRCPNIGTITPMKAAAALKAVAMLGTLDTEVFSQELGAVARRRATMTAFSRRCLRSLLPVIAETGCQRAANDVGAGMSTTLLGLIASAGGGHLLSIDNDAAHLAIAQDLAGDLPVTFYQSDAAAFFQRYAGAKFDGVYLDSADTWTPDYTGVCLREAQAVVTHLMPDGVILVDDTIVAGDGWKGKGEQAVPWLCANGWRVAGHGYQVFLERKK